VDKEQVESSAKETCASVLVHSDLSAETDDDDDDEEEEEEEEEKSPSSPSSSLEAETLTEQSSVFCVPPGNAFVVSIVHHGSSRANYKCGREAIDVY